MDLEGRIAQNATRVISSNWFEVGPEMDVEELLLRNTFLNAKNAPLDEHLVNPQLGKIGIFSPLINPFSVVKMAKIKLLQSIGVMNV